MSIDSPSERPGYEPSGKCDWLKLITIALPFSLLVAAALAVALMAAFHWGFYFFLVAPCLAGAILGAAAAGLFRFAHCRNPHLAAVLGVLLGSVMYLGYFHAHYVYYVGPRGIARIDLLPRFIQYRMRHDIIKDMHDVGNQNPRPAPVMNWVWFAADWLCAAGVCAAIVFSAARRAYCENCQRWMVRKKAATPSGTAQPIVAAITAKQIASLAELPAVEAKGTVSQLEVEYCPGRTDQTDVCPIYFTAKEIIPGQKKTIVVARQMPLTVEDLAELSKKLTFQ